MSIQRAAMFLVPSVLFLASCGGSQGTQALATKPDDHVLTGPPTHIAAATLTVTTGTRNLRVKVDQLGGALFRVETPSNSGVHPLVRLDGNTVRVGQTSSGRRLGRDDLEVFLTPSVRWTINLNGGSSVATVNLSGGALAALNFRSGVSQASVWLPAPDGDQAVRLLGGATDLSIVATSTAPAQVTVAGGASRVVFDGMSHEGVAGGTVFGDPTWAAATHRYSIDLASGVSVFHFSRAS
jgi:hypothetical protein